jgi:hypothetical protein
MELKIWKLDLVKMTIDWNKANYSAFKFVVRYGLKV